MATLSPANSHLAIHLSDRALTTIVSTSQPSTSTTGSNTQAQALSSLTTAAISAYDSASRLTLGLPQRVMIETQDSGPLILHSYLNPRTMERQVLRGSNSHTYVRRAVEEARENMRPVSATGESSAAGGIEDRDMMVNGIRGLSVDNREGVEDDDGTMQGENEAQQPPLLIATVVASRADEVREARQAAARLERMGRELQREWVREQEQQVTSTSEAMGA